MAPQSLSEPASKFELPFDEQPFSMLCRLPVEIRLMILRHLLKAGQLIQPRYSVKRLTSSAGTRLNSCKKLSPRILRTCQLLFQEAHKVLYFENRMQIEVANSRMAYGWTVKQIPSDGECLQVPPALSQFPSLTITCYEGTLVDKFSAIWALQNIVRGKKIEIDLSQGHAATGINDLAEFKLWRCRDVTFTNIPERILHEDLRDIIECIKSDKLVNNLPKRYIKARSTILALPWNSYRGPIRPIARDLEAMKEAALESRSEEVDIFMRKVRGSALEWHQRRKSAKLERSEASVRRMQSSLEIEIMTYNAHTKSLRELCE